MAILDTFATPAASAVGSAVGNAVGPALGQYIAPNPALPIDDAQLDAEYAEALEYYQSGALNEDLSPTTLALCAAAGGLSGWFAI